MFRLVYLVAISYGFPCESQDTDLSFTVEVHIFNICHLLYKRPIVWR